MSPASGQQMYSAYCAVCHGNDGKGGGPAAEALKVPPPDLTVLARKNGGKKVLKGSLLPLEQSSQFLVRA
ncbi:MAG: cytochrome c [Acidobacteriia bacterium]|nr:cytochrome c [Terriglobia bacterium]